jgi:arylsulfatase A-like enzyme
MGQNGLPDPVAGEIRDGQVASEPDCGRGSPFRTACMENWGLMDSTIRETVVSRLPVRTHFSPTAAIVLAPALGLCAGYVEVAIILGRKLWWNPEGYFRAAGDFPWSVPVSLAALMLIPGVAVAAASWFWPRPISLRAGSWLLATLALWAALLRLPLYDECRLLLAAGIGRLIGDAVAAHRAKARRALLTVLGLLALLAAGSSGRQLFREYWAVHRLPPAPPRARNVVLIVWDTVRAYNLGTFGYSRNTTPHLESWTRTGVKYGCALAAAPWTFPSHSCFFTGQWPLKLDAQRKMTLDTADPILADYLASRGYQTAGFVANTSCCTYESGLARGFAHFEDYSLAPLSILARTVAGEWVVTSVLRLGGWYDAAKWSHVQSRDAKEINSAFLGWLDGRRLDRPFFAFLNYFDAHDPFLPPERFLGRFGTRPRDRRDYDFLLDYFYTNKHEAAPDDIVMARDCYDDCIAYLDEQLGHLLGELGRLGHLADTEVIITSDHGEEFGEHGLFGHCFSVNLAETAVPLVMLSPDAPAGRVIHQPVSLRDLPATVVDRLGLSAGSPFPGRSLAVYWKSPPGGEGLESTSPAFSEQFNKTGSEPQIGPWGMSRGFQMSVVSSNHHYIRDGAGHERLYNLKDDPFERVDLLQSTAGKNEVKAFRRKLLDVLIDNPGSLEVERDYLEQCRRSLEALVGEAHVPGADDDRRSTANHAGQPRRPAS